MSTRPPIVHLTKASFGRLRAECGVGKWKKASQRLRLSGDLEKVTCRKCLMTNAAMNRRAGR